jgi:hypothetical protein
MSHFWILMCHFWDFSLHMSFIDRFYAINKYWHHVPCPLTHSKNSSNKEGETLWLNHVYDLGRSQQTWVIVPSAGIRYSSWNDSLFFCDTTTWHVLPSDNMNKLSVSITASPPTHIQKWGAAQSVNLNHFSISFCLLSQTISWRTQSPVSLI